MKKRIIFFLLLIITYAAAAQQVVDSAFSFQSNHPKHKKEKGLRVSIDGGHNNFHQAGGRYLPFSNVLRNDGYVVKAMNDTVITERSLKKTDVLVIANAINVINTSSGIGWVRPIHSAFSEAEIKIINNWVKNGGRLMLIADHMPFAGAANDLAKSFGFEFSDGFATCIKNKKQDFFSRSDKTLIDDLSDADSHSRVTDSITTFTGSAFKAPSGSRIILAMDDSCKIQVPDTAWQFHPSTPEFRGNGWSQGAATVFGKGKIVVFGEAAMYTAQLAGPSRIKVGMNASYAPQNAQLLLNVFHWLEKKEKKGP